MSHPGERDGSWTLLTGHGHVLVEIARNPESRIRDLSGVAGITERTVQAIVADLEAAGYITRTRTGRRTRYTVNQDSLFRHSAQDGHRVGPVATHKSMQNGQVMSSPTALRAPSPRTSSSSSAGPSWP